MRTATPLSENLRQLLDLHEQIAQGKGDDQVADEIRDRMDATWRKLTEREQKLASTVSVALYAAEDQRLKT